MMQVRTSAHPSPFTRHTPCNVCKAAVQVCDELVSFNTAQHLFELACTSLPPIPTCKRPGSH